MRFANGILLLPIKLNRDEILYVFNAPGKLVRRVSFCLVGVPDLPEIEGGRLRVSPYGILGISIISASPRRVAYSGK